MFRNNIAFKGICTIILFITMGISHASVPVTLEIGNAQDDPAGGTCSNPTFTTQATCEASGTAYWTAFTLDIIMTNQTGCSYCDDSTFNPLSSIITISSKGLFVLLILCLVYGSL